MDSTKSSRFPPGGLNDFSAVSSRGYSYFDRTHLEGNENILNLCTSSPTARNKLERALEETPSGAFRALEYSEYRDSRLQI